MGETYDGAYNFDVDGVPRGLRGRIQRDYASAMDAWNGWPAVREVRDPYLAPVDGYWWGSNATKARRGAVYTQSVAGEAPGRFSPCVTGLTTAVHEQDHAA